MNIKYNLQDCYRNVSFEADNVWQSNIYQQKNLDLYRTEKLQVTDFTYLRPRTVNECIPVSKLTCYSNFSYHESREMSYASNITSSKYSTIRNRDGEIWETPEVDDLFVLYIKHGCKSHICNEFICNFPNIKKINFESPFLNVTNLEERILKIDLLQDRIKAIWDTKIKTTNEQKPFKTEIPQDNQHMFLNVYLSPLDNFFVSHKTDSSNTNSKINSVTDDFQHLKSLKQSFEKQINCLSEFYNKTVPDSQSPEILYSDVLQGKKIRKKILSFDFDDIHIDDKTNCNEPLTTTKQRNFYPYQHYNQLQQQLSQTYFYPVFDASNNYNNFNIINNGNEQLQSLSVTNKEDNKMENDTTSLHILEKQSNETDNEINNKNEDEINNKNNNDYDNLKDDTNNQKNDENKVINNEEGASMICNEAKVNDTNNKPDNDDNKNNDYI